MIRYLILSLLFLPVVIWGTGVSLLSQSSDLVKLRFEMPEYSLETVIIEGRQYQKILSDEGMVHTKDGFPELRVFSVALGIPLNGSISAKIVRYKTETIENVDLVPSATMYLDGEDPCYKYDRSIQAFNNMNLYPESLTEIGSPAFIGDRRFTSLMIYPFQYRASTKELIVYKDVEIDVSISGSKSSTKNWQSSTNIIDNAGDSFFVNNATSKMWRLEKSRSQSYQSPKNSLGSINEIQFIIDNEGIYKIGYNELKQFVQGSLDSLGMQMVWHIDSVDPRFLELSDEYGQVPIYFSGENDGSFDPGDYFEFFGDRHYGDTAYNDDYTAENVYTLTLKASFGARMVVENGGLIESNSLSYIVPDAYEETLHFEQQLISDKLGRGWSVFEPEYFKEDVWFWKKINAPNLEIVPIDLEYPIDSTIRTASAKIAMHGLTYSETLSSGQTDHDVTIRLNQAMVNTHTWIGQTEKIFVNQAPISNSFLRHGVNNLYISLSGNTPMGTREQVLLDYIEVKYWRRYITDRDYIKFTKPSNRPASLYQFEIEGFSSPNVSVYKVGSSIFNSLQVEAFNTNGVGPWTVTMQDYVSSDAVRYYAVEEASKKQPKLMRLNIPSDLKNPSNAANVVLITPYQFTKSEGTLMLRNIWEVDGHQVKIIDIQDIYDEFNFGIVSGDAVKSFLQYAYNNWSTPELSHVILLGEGIADSRDNSPSRKYNLIPVPKKWTSKHGATASDTWYGCIVGEDSVPDIVIARVNIWTDQQIIDYAQKAYNYRNNKQTNRLWNSHITLTAGGKITDSSDIFAQQSERIRRKTIPQDYRVSRVYTTTQTVSSDYFGGTFNLKDAINTGTLFLQFMGHGGGRIWSDYNLFNFSDVATLNNQVYPVVLSLACYASSFDTNGAASISEALVGQANKGSIVSLGFTGLGYLDQDEVWGLAFHEAVFKHDFPSFGEAYNFALARFYTTTSLTAARYALTYGSAFLGDPLIKFNKPITDMPVSVTTPNPQPGDVLQVSATFPPEVNSARLFIMKENEKTINVPFDVPVLGGVFNGTYNIPTNTNNLLRRIYVAGYSANHEYIGRGYFGVGRPIVMHDKLLPSIPSFIDSVGFVSKSSSLEQVVSMTCKVRTDSISTAQGPITYWTELTMEKSVADTTQWITNQKLRRYSTGKELFYKYSMRTASNRVYESPLMSYVVAGPDLFLNDIKFDNTSSPPVVRVKSTNVGNAPSLLTDLSIYITPSGNSTTTLYSTQDFLPLGVNETRWDTISLDNLPNSNVTLQARVNTTNAFSEWHFYVNTNNYISIFIPFNYFTIGSGETIVNSLDTNLKVKIPTGFVPQGSLASITVNTMSALLPLNQPDVQKIKLKYPDGLSGNRESVPYEIRFVNSDLVDSLGIFTGGKRLTLTYYYDPVDPVTQQYESSNTYKIYRYNEEFQKWILHGGHVSSTENTVDFEVNRQGIYSIFRNADNVMPTIDVNVQDQEFTVGGYIAGDGVISLLMSDANGIDVIDNSIKLFINGIEISPYDFVISINKENINRIPVKYQLSLGKGNHELKVDCRDLNGNFHSREVQFIVNDKFDIVNIGNYPNPVLGRAQDPKNDGRTRFTYVLTDTADDVEIKIYTISGRLVRTLSNLPTSVGYHEYPRTVHAWDCKDEYGFPLANGTYFYRFVARRGNKKIEKIMKMAILK